MSWNKRILATIFSFSLAALFSCRPARAENVIAADELSDKLRGMWLGQLIGNAAGRETEGVYRSSEPNPDAAVPWVIKQVWDADDDTDIEYLYLHTLDTHGLDCTAEEIAEQWQQHVTTSGIYIANRQAWYLMQDGYLPPETGSRRYNEHWYAIDSQITTEVLGAISPGLVQPAIDLAGKFGRVTNAGFPVHAAQFYTAMYAAAFFEPNVVDLVTEGLKAIPTTSRTHQVVSDVLGWYRQDAADGTLDWRATRYKLYDNYQGANSYGRYYKWVESTVNTGATVLAVLYGQGDFKETVQIGVLAGWDCDCNPATAGGLIGIIDGFSGLAPDLTDPNICGDVYKNVYRPYLPDPNLYVPQYDTITNVVARLTHLSEQSILGSGGYITGSGPTKSYHIPDGDPVTPEPEKPDPGGPAGLVGEALAAGISVTPTAAVQRYDASYDRHNLDAIIDGITDNSYNGHKPYWSRTTVPPAQDWYQLNFSESVEFESLTFWEGDVVWQAINTYYRDDTPQGGFFEDLTVEIVQGGKTMMPANLSMSSVLDRFAMYQKITFTFSPTVGDVIRITGTPGGTRGYTTIMELEVAGSLDTSCYVTGFEVAQGQVQRSSISEVAVTFSENVQVGTDDIQLIGTSYGTFLAPDQIRLVYDNPAQRLTLDFDINGDGLFGDLLPDDTYDLMLDCDSLRCPGGHTFGDDDDNPADGFCTIRFHCLFGDADGSAAVDFADLAVLASHWLRDPAQTGLDSNADNILDLSDLAAFCENWLVIFWPEL
jgi:hypothetical protein